MEIRRAACKGNRLCKKKKKKTKQKPLNWFVPAWFLSDLRVQTCSPRAVQEGAGLSLSACAEWESQGEEEGREEERLCSTF